MSDDQAGREDRQQRRAEQERQIERHIAATIRLGRERGVTGVDRGPLRDRRQNTMRLEDRG